MKFIPNPDCKLPDDAIALSDADYHALLEAHYAGDEIAVTSQGTPFTRAAIVTVEGLMARARARRDRALDQGDKMMMPHRPMTKAKRKAWHDHMVAMRDLPATLKTRLDGGTSPAEMMGDLDHIIAGTEPQP